MPVARRCCLVRSFHSTDHWRHNIPLTAQTHSVYALDLLGFGAVRSLEPCPRSALWRDQLVRYVRGVIRAPP